MALRRGEKGVLAKLKAARRASEQRRQAPPVLKQAAPRIARARGLDRTNGLSAIRNDESMRDPFTFAVAAVLLWLNGSRPSDKKWPFLAPKRVEEVEQISKSSPSRQEFAIGWTQESRDRIIYLLEKVQGMQASIEEAYGDHFKSRPDSVIRLTEIDTLMKRYVTYPTLSFHVGRQAFAVLQNPANSEWDRLVELTEEERQEKDPAKRRNYSIGPGRMFLPTPEESAVLASLYRSKVMPAPGSKERAILNAFNKRSDAACTHKRVPPDTPYEEIAAAHAIMDLAMLGVIHKIRSCGVCGKWYYPKKIDQVGCADTECKRERNKRKPGYAEAQAAKQQRYKDKKKVAQLRSDRKKLLEAAKGHLTEEQEVHVDQLEAEIAALQKGIKASAQKAADNKAGKNRAHIKIKSPRG